MPSKREIFSRWTYFKDQALKMRLVFEFGRGWPIGGEEATLHASTKLGDIVARQP